MSVRVINWVFEQSLCTGNDRLVLLAIADEARDGGLSPFVSMDALAMKARVDRKTVMRAISRLEESGELWVDRPEVRARGRANRYIVAMGRDLSELSIEASDGPAQKGDNVGPLENGPDDGTAAVPQRSHEPPESVPSDGTAPVSSPCSKYPPTPPAGQEPSTPREKGSNPRALRTNPRAVAAREAEQRGLRQLVILLRDDPESWPNLATLDHELVMLELEAALDELKAEHRSTRGTAPLYRAEERYAAIPKG